MAGAEIGALVAQVLKAIAPYVLGGVVLFFLFRWIRGGAVAEHQVKGVKRAKTQRSKNVSELKEARKRMRNAGLRGWLSKRRRLQPPPS